MRIDEFADDELPGEEADEEGEGEGSGEWAEFGKGPHAHWRRIKWLLSTYFESFKGMQAHACVVAPRMRKSRFMGRCASPA